MSTPHDRLKIELLIDANHPDLLQGLEDWLRLGLISDRQIKILARSQLCNPLPLPDQPEIDHPADAAPVTATIPASDAAPPHRPAPTAKPRRRSWLEQLLQAFMAEITVVWLLFLGVFLVVASSAAIAAIQWRYVSPVGQYSILLGYTLAFGVAGLWASKKDNLQVTGRMLQIASLLIIPVNFWMMDGFRLWSMPMGWLIMAIGTMALGFLQWRLLGATAQRNRWNSFLLNGLQWGWQVSFVPITFTYIGTVITAFIQAIAQRSRNTEETNRDRRRSLPAITIAFSTLLLVVRAVFIAGVPVTHFGLALGIIGWLLYWLDRAQSKTAWLQAGAALLGFGWLISYIPNSESLPAGFDPLWQPLAISGLALWAVGDRLHRFWSKPALLGFWAIGWQTYALLRVLLPLQTRRSIMTYIQTAAQLQAGAFELTGLGFFAYIVITLALARYLKSRQKFQLATLTKQLALGLGLLLALPSLLHPLVRAIYFSLCALLVFVYWWRDRHVPRISRHHQLIYLCHVCGLIAIVSWIDWTLPKLQPQHWAWILLTGALLEWGVVALSRDQFWQKSAWFLGVVQAACAYPLMFNAIDMDGGAAYNGLPWLLVPAGLTGLGAMPQLVYRQQSMVLSVLTSLLALIITFTSLNPFLIALAATTALLVINTLQLQHRSIAAMAVGTGLLYGGLQVWSVLERPAPRWYLLFLAIALWTTWLLRDWLARWNNRQSTSSASGSSALVSPSRLFLNAANGWGMILASTIGLLLGLLVTVGLLETGLKLPWYELTLAGSVSFIAILYRIAQQPTDLGLWGLTIGAAILINLTAQWLALPLADRVVSTLILGFGTLCAGEWWRRVRQGSTHWTSYNGVPLCYGTIALLLAHTQFTALTGIYTLVIGLLGLLLGRRSSNLAVISIMALIAVTFGAYECLIYQLMQAKGGVLGDAVTLLALLPAMFALFYASLARPLRRLFRQPRRVWQNTSLCHWVWGSLLGLSTPLLGLSATGEWLWIGALTLFAMTATWHGRRYALLIYPALWQWTSAIALFLMQILPDVWLSSWGAVIAGVFTCGVYGLPWVRWGWPERPWQVGSLGLPLIIALMTIDRMHVPALLLTGSCYGMLAWRKQQVRLSYWGLGFACWGLWRWLNDWQLDEPVWYAAVLSLAVLYVVEVEPTLQVSDAKARRHLIRCGAIGLFCLTLFYQDTNLWFRSLMTLVIAIGLIALGLLRRTRAYLYVGTLTFLWAVLRTLWLFILDQSLLLWALGLATGATLIWIAATFEARRSQTRVFVQYWVNELDSWE